MSVSVNFILSDDRDGETRIQHQDLLHIPKPGDHVSLLSTRANDGSYVYERPKKLFEGTVTRVEYSIDEWGSGPSSHRIIQIINVYLKPY
jgi:hypothetical protein